jgi:hypothetical protein
MSDSTISRRELIRRGGVLGSLLALPAGLRATQGAPKTATTAAAGLRTGASVYQSIGVRPLINARGTFTIISGSTMLPEVREAMDAAARQYVHLDELAEAVGARLAQLTRAEWGLVTNGCSAGLTLATQSGATLAEVMRRAGHSTQRAAMIYQHAAEDRDREVARRLSESAEARRLGTRRARRDQQGLT